MAQTVVLYPSLGIGHLIPMMELANIFLKHGCAVTVALLDPPIKRPDFDATLKRIADSNPSVSFHVLPPIPPLDLASSGKHPFLLMFDLLRSYDKHLRSFLCSLPLQRVRALVVDMFTTDALDVAEGLGIPAYTFFSSGASALAMLTQLTAFCSNRKTGLSELGDTPLEFLGVPPMPASHLIKEMLLHPDDELYKSTMRVWEHIQESKGIMVNTSESLESRAMQALRDPLCVPGRAIPPVYCVGPLVGKGANDENTERHECLAWLDAQPDRSVVFLCFGSMGTFLEEQIKETAVGLENSGHRFLWVVRAPTASDDTKRFLESLPEPDLGALLPAGFLERTNDRGLVIKSWAPQVDVLHHRATGAFVTHCGWNSTLEGVTAGVPMLCWPLYAEQKMNKVFIVEEMKVGVEMEGYHTGFVKAEEVEAKVRLVMDSEQGEELRARVAAHKEAAAAALEDGGSSDTAFVQFLLDVDNIVKAPGESE